MRLRPCSSPPLSLRFTSTRLAELGLVRMADALTDRAMAQRFCAPDDRGALWCRIFAALEDWQDAPMHLAEDAVRLLPEGR